MRKLHKDDLDADEQATGEAVMLQQFFVGEAHLVAVVGACLDVLQCLIRRAFGFRLVVGIDPALQLPRVAFSASGRWARI